MSGSPKVPVAIRACPFCGVATDVNHETQEVCIAALHNEIGRMRNILSALKPTGVRDTTDTHSDAVPIRLLIE